MESDEETSTSESRGKIRMYLVIGSGIRTDYVIFEEGIFCEEIRTISCGVSCCQAVDLHRPIFDHHIIVSLQQPQYTDNVVNS